MLAGTAAFSGLALLLAGTLRAEATLAVANLIYLVLLGMGGMIFPLTKFPAAARAVLTLLPSGALSDGLHAVLQYGAGLPARDLAVLVVWAAVGHRDWPRGVPLGVAAASLSTSPVPPRARPAASPAGLATAARAHTRTRAAVRAGRHRHLLGPVRRRARGQAVHPDPARRGHRAAAVDRRRR